MVEKLKEANARADANAAEAKANADRADASDARANAAEAENKRLKKMIRKLSGNVAVL